MTNRNSGIYQERNRTYHNNTDSSAVLAQKIRELEEAVQESSSSKNVKPHFGSGKPDNSLGKNDDVYLDTDSGNLYEKSEDSWSLVMEQKNFKGEDGKSAYEIAKDNGFEGNKQEWLDSLHGKDGTNGNDGTDGFPSEKQWNNLVTRIDDLEKKVNNGSGDGSGK